MARSADKTKGSKGQTPLMRQYFAIKDRHPNAILLFRMGDFYETFEDDAVTVSEVLGITLTKRSNGKASDVALAGFPHHALDNYLPRLVQAGLRVAVCEQLEDPKFARKIVKRDVVEVVTPGVSFHDQLLDPKRSNYLGAVYWERKGKLKGWAGFAFIDASTGEFSMTEVHGSRLVDLLHTVGPAEIIADKRESEGIAALRQQGFMVTPQEDWCFGADFAQETLLRHFKTHSLKGFGIDEHPMGVIAAGAALYYLSETQKGKLPHVKRITRYASEQYMTLDTQTKRNLELIASMQHGGVDGSLVQILDATATPMGGRLLRKWLVRPLRDLSLIEQRLDAVEAIASSQTLRQHLQDVLKPIGDLERLAVKASTERANPRELVQLKATLLQIPEIQQILKSEKADVLRDTAKGLDPLEAVVDVLETSLVEDPPAQLNDGGIIRPGHNAELDELRDITKSGKDWMARMQQEESERTGIPSLKIGFNKVFGYYLEVTNTHRDKVPDDYIRKQTLVNAERYITPKLKEYEEKILTAEERIQRLEAELFHGIRSKVAEATEVLQHNAFLLATLDCIVSLAVVAERNRYTRPQLHEGGELDIVDGRHPVVEQLLPAGEPFIANSVQLDPAERQILIITGPNMAGKSVVLRQTGLIVLLAQVGSFVPAESARIGLVDRIFTRVGASDNLAAGESTFLVEMNEAANILNNATPRSLILLDEVGRGTSTFDGLSIAWSLVEYLHENPDVAARTLFATHYHELNELSERFPRVANVRVQVQEHEGKVIFLRKLAPGGADHSYGIEVARMAGLPAAVIVRAQEILRHLESQQLAVHAGDEADAVDATSVIPRQIPAMAPPTPESQLSLFDPGHTMALELLEQLRRLDPERLSPVEALLKLIELKKKADDAA